MAFIPPTIAHASRDYESSETRGATDGISVRDSVLECGAQEHRFGSIHRCAFHFSAILALGTFLR